MAPTLIGSCAQACRRVAAALIAALWRREEADAVERRLRALPARAQAAIVGATLAGLFLTSLLFAQFGLVGLLVFLLAVVLLIR